MTYKRNNKIKILSLIYCLSTILFLMLSLSLIISSNGYKIDTWQNYAAFDFEKEVAIDDNGKQVEVNLISTPEQLAGMFLEQSGVHADDYKGSSLLSGKIYKLKNSISLKGRSWSPSKLSSGYIFDGGGFAITDLNVKSNGYAYSISASNVGFVGTNYGIIQNIVFDNAKISYSYSGSQVNVGIVAGSNFGILQNVTTTSNCSITSSSSNTYRIVGGLVGVNNFSSSNFSNKTIVYDVLKTQNLLTSTETPDNIAVSRISAAASIFRCFNNASVSSGNWTGGIVGWNSNGNIIHSYNYGSVSANCGSSYVGGICGITYSSSISMCINYGSVSNTTSSTINWTCCGGITGYAKDVAIVAQNGNVGTITATCSNATASYAGGIVAYSLANITNCFNRGNVTADSKEYSNTENISHDNSTSTVHTDSNLLIVVVYNHYYEWKRFYVSGPSNDTHYALQRTIKYRSAYAGGIVGYLDTSKSASNSYNTGEISGGKKIYNDVYAHTTSYTEDHHTVIMGVWTYNYSTECRVYYDFYNYDYEYYYNSICGNEIDLHNNCYGTMEEPTINLIEYKFVNYSYSHSSTHFLTGGLIDLINLAIKPSNSSSENVTAALTSYKKDSTLTKGDSYSVNGISSVTHTFSKSDDKKTLNFKFSFKTPNGVSHANTKSQTVVNKKSEETRYQQKVDSDMRASSMVNSLGSSYWEISSDANNNYPYIKGMFWR